MSRLAFPTLFALLFTTTAGLAATLDEAQEHLQKGRYDEAIEAFEALAEGELKADEAAAVAIGHSRALEETGRRDEAAKVVDAARDGNAKSAVLLARRAQLHQVRGEFTEAEKLAKQAIALDADQPLARWVQAEVLMETGRLEEADIAYRWFVRYYNRKQPKDAETLVLVAEGSAQYARWHAVPSIFNFIINDLCPDALKDDELSWRTWELSGTLLLEKFNRAQALPEFEGGLAVNARSARLLTRIGEARLQRLDSEKALTKAKEALAIDPHHVAALRLKADVQMHDGSIGEAIETLQAALEVNPRDQRTLARLAACYVLVDGEPEPAALEAAFAMFGKAAKGSIDPETRFERLLVEIASYNRRPGYFLADLAESLDGRRKYDMAEVVYERASQIMPRLSAPKVGLGLLHMRVGRVAEAVPILDAAFKADPYHVRVSNMRKVLKVLKEYETIETEHFIVQFDGEKDRVLGREVAEYLEEIYPIYTKLYGFEPPNKTRFELYNEHKGLSGHQWFSARMIGLPWIQTIGATTGMIVALASPNDTGRSYNWAQVCRHEFVHVITLQQTEFNIPHWFTEALAVTSEGYPRPTKWNDLLLKRVPARDLRTLKNLTDGFVRPRNADDWQFAYCQSKLYADYMRAEYGDASIRRLLAAYEDNKTTTEAVPDVFGVDLETFEKGYLKYLDDLVATLRGGDASSGRTPEEIAEAYEAKPDDPANMAALARVKYAADERDEARTLASKALEADPKQATAAVVLARLELRASNRKGAAETLRAALDEKSPHADLVSLLAKLELATGNDDESARLFELGRKAFPHDPQWIKGLAAVRLKSGDASQQRTTLTVVANTESDDASVRKRLATLALEDDDYEAALRWSTRGLHITAHDAALHVARGRALAGLKKTAEAKQSFERALQLDAENEDAKTALAELDE